MNAPNELRLFISSTFQDLQEEREHLIKKIFPEIRSLCRERGIRFTEVDLRWGLTDEDVALGQVIRTCLDEVDKCRPYFIGITGDRYGFIPSFLDIQKDPQLLEQHPWIEEAAIDGMSITEMEAQYAVLRNDGGDRMRDEAVRAHFYFRRHRESLDDNHELDEERQRLEGYQQRIRQSGVSIEQFRDPVSLGELIYDDLIAIIKRDFADARPSTPLEAERARHEAFSLSRRRAYIPNPVYLKRLSDHVTSDGPPLLLYSESGSGKSSLFAYWAELYRREHPEAHLIEHYVGIGATATAHYGIIRHVCMEIKERFGREEEIPTEPRKLETALGQWLGYADHALRRVRLEHAPSSDSSFSLQPSALIILVDGLNQLEGTALNLRWIPEVISPSIRLVISSTIEGTLEEIQRRGWVHLGMQALTEAERETIVVRYLAEYHKSLTPEQIKLVASDPKCGHPLFLKTMLEELRLLGRHDVLDATIESHLQTTGTEDLFQRVLERLEEDYSLRTVREVMSLLGTTRGGLDERELSGLSGLARLKIATMTAGLDYHLVRKEGRLSFFHDYLRRAVEVRYVGNEAKGRALHLRIATWFQQEVDASLAQRMAVSGRAASELAHHLRAADAEDRLATCLTTLPIFLTLYSGEASDELLRYWSAMDRRIDMVAMYRRGLIEWETTDPEERSRGMGRLSGLLERLGYWTEAIDLERERLALSVEHRWKSEEAASRQRIGWLLNLRGEYAEAYEELKRALDLSTALEDPRGISHAVGNMGVLFYSRGEYARAMECYKRQLSIAEKLGDRDMIANTVGNIGGVHGYCGEYDLSMECYEHQLRIAEELGDRSGASRAIGNMGVVHYSRGDYDRALSCSERCLHISRELGDGNGVGSAIGSLGDVYSSSGEYDRALECYQQALKEHRALGYTFGMTFWLEGVARLLLTLRDLDLLPTRLMQYLPIERPEEWRSIVLQQARVNAEECLTFSRALNKQDTLFAAQVLLARIQAVEGKLGDAMAELSQLLAESNHDDERAEVYYWRCRVSRELKNLEQVEQDRQDALRIYRVLYEQQPSLIYRMRIDELEAGPA